MIHGLSHIQFCRSVSVREKAGTTAEGLEWVEGRPQAEPDNPKQYLTCLLSLSTSALRRSILSCSSMELSGLFCGPCTTLPD